jgi:hypothetical protein
VSLRSSVVFISNFLYYLYLLRPAELINNSTETIYGLAAFLSIGLNDTSSTLIKERVFINIASFT